MEGLTMNIELIGQVIVSSLISLIIGGLGFVQYKSNIPFIVGFDKEGYDLKIVSKIVGLHVMISAVFLFISPMIFNQMKEIGDSKLMGGILVSIILMPLVLSINIAINKTAKISPKIIKNND